MAISFINYLRKHRVSHDCGNYDEQLDYPILFVKSMKTARIIASKFGYVVFDSEYDEFEEDYIVTLKKVGS